MSQYRGNIGNLLQHWVLCELVCSANSHWDDIRFVDAYSMAPLATERFKSGWSAAIFDYARDRHPADTPYERAWRKLVPDDSGYPNSAAFVVELWRGTYSLLLCEYDDPTVQEVSRWAAVQAQSPGCTGVEVAQGDWRVRFQRPVSDSDALTLLSFDPDMFDRHGTSDGRKMDPDDLNRVAAAVEPIPGGVLLQLSTYSVNHANSQDDVTEAVVSGLSRAGLELLALLRTDRQMMSLVFGKGTAALRDIASLPGRFDSWLSRLRLGASGAAAGTTN